MAIGKAAIIFFAFAIGAVALVSIFAIAHQDKSTDTYYTDTNNSVNKTIAMTEGVSGAVVGTTGAYVLVVAILFFGAAIAIFGKRKG